MEVLLFFCADDSFEWKRMGTDLSFYIFLFLRQLGRFRRQPCVCECVCLIVWRYLFCMISFSSILSILSSVFVKRYHDTCLITFDPYIFIEFLTLFFHKSKVLSFACSLWWSQADVVVHSLYFSDLYGNSIQIFRHNYTRLPPGLEEM